MNSLYSFLETRAALPLLMITLFLMIGQTAAFLLSVREKRNRRQTPAAGLHLLIVFLLFVIILDGYDSVYFETIPRDSVQTGWFVYSLPWLIYAALEAISAVILTHSFMQYRRYRQAL